MAELGMLVAGSALGAAFEFLFSAVLKAKSTAKMFQTHLGNLNTTLDSLKLVIIQLASANHLVPLEKSLEKFTTKMKEGKKLVDECCEVRWFNLIKQHEYTHEIEALNDSLRLLLSTLTVELGCHAVMMLHLNGAAQNKNQIGVRCAVPPLKSEPVGLDAPLDDLKMTLLGDGPESILVLTAPGGCGKTTLATKFCHDPRVKDKFKENIFFATVSKKLSYLIVQELCEHAGLVVPALQNEENPFQWLQQFMTERGQNPLLLVLDDVPSESESLLDQFNEFKTPSCRVLVTSRYHFPRFGRTYPLETLNGEDAMALFRRSAFLPNTSSNIPDDLQEEIVELCKRFPLAITVIGNSLCNRPIDIWRTKLMDLSEGSILELDEKLLPVLKSCLDDLDKGMATVKNCFIDLGLFPEDRKIPVTALLDMWAELYEGTEDFQFIANLYELTTRNLANLIVLTSNEDVDGYYGEHFVIQHDMLRLLSIHESCEDPKQQRLIIGIREDELPTWWKERKHNTKNARLVSISTDGSSAKWHNMHLPKAEVLVLNFQTENYVLPKFVKKMSKLKVLIVTNYGVLQADLSNFKLLGSLANLKRIRLERISIPSVSKNSMQLKSLQKISLFMCSIGQAFSNSSIQILEAFPNLVELNIDYCNDLVKLPAKLCDLIRLKKFSITNCHKLSALPEEIIGKLVNLEVLRLRSCTELERLPGSIKNLKKLSLLDICNCFSIKKLPEEIGEMSSLRKIKMVQCLRLLELPASVLNLDQLREVICDEDTENLWGEPFKSNLININIKVVKEDFKLNWLHNL